MFCFQEIGALLSLAVCKFNRYFVCVCVIFPVLFIFVCCESLRKAEGHVCTTTDLAALKPNLLRIISGHVLKCLFKITPLKMRMFIQITPTSCRTLLTRDCKEDLTLSLGEEM